MPDLTPLEEHAVKLVADGTETYVEYARPEDSAAACDLALRIARGIRDNPAAVLALAHVDQFDAGEE